MKSKVSVIVLEVSLLVIAALVAGCSRGYESQKNAGDLTIILKADRYPLVKGDNTMAVTVKDQSGKAVTDASVTVRLYMPPMPGMAPMESTIQAVPKGNQYTFVANAAMEGGWKVEVTAVRPGKPAVTTTFNVDAR